MKRLSKWAAYVSGNGVPQSGGTLWESKAALAAYLIKHPGADMSKHQLVKGAKEMTRASPDDVSIKTPRELTTMANKASMHAKLGKTSHYQAAQAHEAAEAAQKGVGNVKAASMHAQRAAYHYGLAKQQIRATVPQTQPPSGPNT
jgi:hypothetical protein